MIVGLLEFRFHIGPDRGSRPRHQPLPVPTEQTETATPSEVGPNPKEIIKMICDGCGKESADEFTFCPHCGKALAPKPSVIESSPSPSPEVQPVADIRTGESQPIKDAVAGTGIRVGTWVFGAFSAISLLVSMVKGLVPIYLLEAAGWAGVAWYWQGKKTHSDVAKAIVIVLAVLVGIGEVVHIASQPDDRSKQIPPAIHENLFDQAVGQPPTITGGTQNKGAGGEVDLSDLFGGRPQPKAEPKPKPKKETYAGLVATITCDDIVWNREKYDPDGDPLAITSVHKGDTVQYVGHVTVGDQDIIRVHGRKGYVRNYCVEVDLRRDNSDEAQLKTEPKPKKETYAGLVATITCDDIVWNREKYDPDGDPLAITSVHKGDTVQYVGHVTVGDQDIIRVHGRKGYVRNYCVDVKQ
jgi:hypothetical protein